MTSRGSPVATQDVVFVELSSLILHFLVIYLFYSDNSLTNMGFTMWTEQLNQCFESLQKLRARWVR